MAEAPQTALVACGRHGRHARRAAPLRGELLPSDPLPRRIRDAGGVFRLAQRMVSRTYASHTSRCLPADACALDVLA
jgi:hypothetical protein